MFLFNPAIWRNGVLYELPRPVVAVRIQDAWNFEKLKVPLSNGDIYTGHSQLGVDLSVEGKVGTASGTIQATEEKMFLTLESLRAALQVDPTHAPYDFFLYLDNSTKTYRSFRRCTTVRFEYDVSDPHLFTYRIVIHAADPKIWSVGPA